MSLSPALRLRLQAKSNSVIAVTGLGGNAYGSFKERGGSFMWLQDSLPFEARHARFLIYGYNTNITGSQSFQTITDLSGQFQDSLSAIRPVCMTTVSPAPILISSKDKLCQRPLVFIGHSLGGLIIKHVRLPYTFDYTTGLTQDISSGYDQHGAWRRHRPHKPSIHLQRTIFRSAKPRHESIITHSNGWGPAK